MEGEKVEGKMEIRTDAGGRGGGGTGEITSLPPPHTHPKTIFSRPSSLPHT